MIRYFKRRRDIFLANLVNTFQQEIAYFANNWGTLLSTIVFNLMMIFFVEILYSNITMLAGYKKNEMFFLLLFLQAHYYILWVWSRSNLSILSENVRNGNLDFILIRPVSAIFFVTFQEISSIGFLRDCFPGLVCIAFLIKWNCLNIAFKPAIFGISIFIIGLIIWHCFCFLFELSVFWQGQSKQIAGVSMKLELTERTPFEGFEKSFRMLFITLIPTIIAGQLSTSVMLGKSNGPKMLALSAIVAIIFISLKIFFWKLALKNYTSASS